ncbi:hypothetical protein JW848_10110 [Candidatus Bipolaricaulota bacterium]|nr:hypothetical protein [Candidatus Bipolaricaulota bacterium]
MMHFGRTSGLDRYARRNARTRQQRARAIRRSTTPFLLISIILATLGLAFVYLQQSAALLHLTAEREDLRDTLNATLELNSVYADELAHRHALPIVSEIARNRLGMVEPETVTYIFLHDAQP